jgi:hypothetical protein
MYGLLAGTAAVLLLIPLWPWRPSSLQSWILYAVLTLPIMVAGEWVGDKILHNPLSNAVDRVTGRRQFSWLRIVYLLTLALVFIALGLVIASVWHR